MQLMLGVTGLKYWAVQLTEIWKDCPDLTDMWPLPLDSRCYHGRRKKDAYFMFI